MSVWFKSRLNPWYIWIPSNPHLYSTKIIMKMRWQTISCNVSIPHCHPTTKSLWLCSRVYCGPPHPSRRIMVGGRSRQPKKKGGVENYTFCLILMRNKGRNTTFSPLLLKYRGQNYKNFLETWKRHLTVTPLGDAYLTPPFWDRALGPHIK